MCKVNFVDEHNLFMRYARNNQLTGRERLLWMALFSIANDRAIYNGRTRSYDWPDGFFPVTNGELSLHSTLDKRGIESVRNQLKQRGLIDFKSGNRNSKPPEYKIKYLSLDVGYKFVPNDVPNNVPNDVPNNVPNDVPNNVPLYIRLDKGIDIGGDKKSFNDDGDDSARAGGEKALSDFFHWNGQNIDQFFGVSESVKQEAQQVTEQLFSVYGGRLPTSTDRNYVFLETKEYFPESETISLNSERIKLLAYCFEQAFIKNCPGNWKFIQACMRHLESRGIKTLADIEDYDDERR